MSHPLVLALFSARDVAMTAGRAVEALGVPARAISIVARTHDEEGALAKDLGATTGAEIEDSRPAARLGELGGVLIAAAAYVMPGIGPVITAGPLAAELGEMIGHLAGGLPQILEDTGVSRDKALRWQQQVRQGGVLLGVHVVEDLAPRVADTLGLAGADDIEIARWSGELP